MNFLKKLWHWVRWPLLILVVLYAALVIYRIPAVGEKERTATAVAHIHAQKVTLAMVSGDHLPPVPYQPENDATIAGIDKNNNGVRDDVELAIFAKYPHSAKIRAAELQYALNQQVMMTQVFNTDTWKVAAQENSRGYACVGETSSRANIAEHLKNTETLTKEVENLVINTPARISAWHQAYTFTTSYGDLEGESCDIDISSISN